MRTRLALVFIALAVMLAVGFLVPLGRSVQSQARLRALAGAQSDARGVATALAAVADDAAQLTPAALQSCVGVLSSLASADAMAGTEVAGRIEPVRDETISSILAAGSNVHAANAEASANELAWPVERQRDNGS